MACHGLSWPVMAARLVPDFIRDVHDFSGAEIGWHSICCSWGLACISPWRMTVDDITGMDVTVTGDILNANLDGKVDPYVGFRPWLGMCASRRLW